MISYTDENTSVAKFRGSKGEGVFLISIEVDDMVEDVEMLKNSGLDFVFKEALRGEYGAVNFVHPKSAHGVQLEIYEAKR